MSADLIPIGLVRVETSETLQGFVLVVPGSPEHAHFTGSTIAPDSEEQLPGEIADPAAYAAALASGALVELARPKKRSSK